MLLMGKSTISMAIFNSYVSLPEDNPHFSPSQVLQKWAEHRAATAAAEAAHNVHLGLPENSVPLYRMRNHHFPY